MVWNGIDVDERSKEQWDGLDRAVVQALGHRQAEVNTYRRDWYDNHAQRWATTPWGMGLYFRQLLDNFAQGFQDRDEFSCDNASSVFVFGGQGLATMNWSDPDEFFSRMPVSYRVDNTWIHFTIGLLILAAMPIRTVQFPEKSPFPAKSPKANKLDVKVTFTESLQAWMARKLKAGPKEAAMVHFTISKSENRARQANVLHNPFDQNGSAVLDPAQSEYLDLVDRILENIIQVRAIVSGPWYREIELLSRDLREQRTKLVFKYPLRHTIRWATRWNFHVPEYDPENLDWIQWDESNQTWSHYATAPPPSLSPLSSLSSSLTPPPSSSTSSLPPLSDMSLSSSSSPLSTPPPFPPSSSNSSPPSHSSSKNDL
ncbi:hypothetical protein F4782DRAFT_446120 [Xylaria castorea]|nr:hypothetical protein F4782DRAFT_446120 [Xylaria castorea]